MWFCHRCRCYYNVTTPATRRTLVTPWIAPKGLDVSTPPERRRGRRRLKKNQASWLDNHSGDGRTATILLGFFDDGQSFRTFKLVKDSQTLNTSLRFLFVKKKVLTDLIQDLKDVGIGWLHASPIRDEPSCEGSWWVLEDPRGCNARVNWQPN